MTTRLLVLLSVLIATLCSTAVFMMDDGRLSAVGSMVAGGGSVLAVLWFSAGLRYQSRQLEEQRKQFSAQFQHLEHASRREALLFAKEILEKAEREAIAQAGVTSINELATLYWDFGELGPILKSNDPDVVLQTFRDWMKKEGPALILLNGIKSAAEVYLRSEGANGVDYTKAPEDFYFIYRDRFSNLPFFNALSGTATWLCEVMVRLAPGRNAAMIAFIAAGSKIGGAKIIKMDKLREDIAKHIAQGYPLPEIAKHLPVGDD